MSSSPKLEQEALLQDETHNVMVSVLFLPLYGFVSDLCVNTRTNTDDANTDSARHHSNTGSVDDIHSRADTDNLPIGSERSGPTDWDEIPSRSHPIPERCSGPSERSCSA
jgi:hypothetical protein